FVGFEFAEIGFAAVLFPRPGEDEALGRFYFAIGPSRGEVFTIGPAGLDAISAANPWLALGGRGCDLAVFFARHEPLFDLFRVGPGCKDTFARSFDEAFEFQFDVFGRY